METVLRVTDGDAFPVTVTPRDRPLSAPAFLGAMISNPISAWPRQVCEDSAFVQKIGRQTVAFISDPELLKVIFAADEERFGKNPIERRVFCPLMGEGILTSEDERWRWQRRTVAPLFRPADLLVNVPDMTAAAQRVVARWRDAGDTSQQPIDPAMKRATFEVVAEALLIGDENVDMEAIERWTSTYLASSSWEMVYALLHLPAWVPHPHKRTASKAARNIRSHLGRLIAKRSHADLAGKDMLSRLLRAADPESGCPMATSQVLDNVITFLIAGHETTYSTLTWALYLLAHAPEWQQRIAEEVEQVTKGRPLAADHVAHLTLCDQVLKEALRLYPPAPLLSRVAKEGVRLAGRDFAEGTMFFVPVYAIHRHRRLWRNPDAFDPTRFNPDEDERRPRFCFMPFGAGARTCIGAAFAMLEATVILATLVQQVRFTPTGDPDPVPLARITLRPKRTLRLQVSFGHRGDLPT
jgi:cytochrome P450